MGHHLILALALINTDKLKGKDAHILPISAKANIDI